jgi:hypothetical protein
MRFGEAAERAAAERRRDILIGLGQGGLIAAVALAVLFPFFHGSRKPPPLLAAQPAAAVVAPATPALQPALVGAVERRLDLGRVRVPLDVTRVAAWAVREADNGDRPFAVVDKRRAQVYVFTPGGRLVGTSPVLLGYAAGDYSVAGIGEKRIEEIKPQERTTPAGRFEAQPGHNLNDERIVWIDYESSLAIHRLRPAPASQRRAERLASSNLQERRITLGCVVVAPAFFDRVVLPTLGSGKSLVYILPEREPVLAGAAGTPHAASP